MGNSGPSQRTARCLISAANGAETTLPRHSSSSQHSRREAENVPLNWANCRVVPSPRGPSRDAKRRHYFHSVSLAGEQDAAIRLEPKHLFTLLMNQLYVARVRGLQGHCGGGALEGGGALGGGGGSVYAKGCRSPAGVWHAATAIALSLMTDMQSVSAAGQ